MSHLDLPLSLPEILIEKVHRVFGDEGRTWLPRLPAILARCREQWSLLPGTMSPFMSMNYIELTRTEQGEEVALKVGLPRPDLFGEMEALRLYGGRSAVRLLDCDRELGAILMRRVKPGTMLWQLDDDECRTRIAAKVMRNVSVPVPAEHGLPTFADWVEPAFHSARTEWDPTELMPRDVIDEAERAFAAIERTKADDVVLHGDLHHENILLDDEAGWVAIDPKGVVGARSLEVGRYVQNRLPLEARAELRHEIVRSRLEILRLELGYSFEELAACALVDCVLSRCWKLQDESLGEDWEEGIELARFLSTLCDS